MFVGGFEATLHSFYTVLSGTCLITIAFSMRMIGRDIGYVTVAIGARAPAASRAMPG